MSITLGGTGIWNSALRYGDAAEVAEVAAELEELGYSALWVGDIGGDLFGSVAALLARHEDAPSSPRASPTSGCARPRRRHASTPR